jgi:DNA-binding PadR family transcriptional regulator
MSSIDLVILGLLMDKPMSAYEMNKEINFRRMNDWTSVSAQAVYKKTIILNKNDFCSGKTVREGEMPEKTVYTITEKGRKAFFELMENYLQEIGKFNSEFNIAMSNIHRLDKETALKLMTKLKEKLLNRTKEIELEMEMKKELHIVARMILKEYYMMHQTMIQWVEEFIEEYKKDLN